MPYNSCLGGVQLLPSCSGVWLGAPSDKMNEITWEGGDIPYSAEHAFGQQYADIVTGDPDELKVTATLKYEEDAALATEQVRAVYERLCDQTFCIRWAPRGFTTGNLRYTTISGKLIAPVYPTMSKDDPDMIKVQIKVTCPRIHTDQVP